MTYVLVLKIMQSMFALEHVVAYFVGKASVGIMVTNEIWHFYLRLKIATIKNPIKLIV